MTITGERMTLTWTGTETALTEEVLVQKVRSQQCVFPLLGESHSWTPAPPHSGLSDPARQPTDVHVDVEMQISAILQVSHPTGNEIVQQ